jgi:hypothetical protein
VGLEIGGDDDGGTEMGGGVVGGSTETLVGGLVDGGM